MLLEGVDIKSGLLAISTGQRVQTLASITISNIHWGDTVQIVITKILKTTMVTKSNPVLILPPFQDSDLCPVLALRQYIKVTKLIRDNCNNLFLAIVKPHKSVSSQTISRWLVDLLKLSGIDSDKFKGHSFRHASTSKAASCGVNVDTILRRVGWTEKSSVFARFYNRPILDQTQFARSVLNISSKD